MTTITHTRGNVTLTRGGSGANTQWKFIVDGQTSDAQQTLIINSPKDINDLKSIIGQVEHASKVLALDE